MKITVNRAPLRICKKAVVVLEQFQKGQIRKKCYWWNHFSGLIVCHHWRLLSKDNCQSWELMSHEKYNKEIQNRK